MRKPRLLSLLIGTTIISASVVLAAQSPQALERFTGTWKQNIAKSKYSPGPGPKSQSAVIKVSEGGLLVTLDFVNARGQQNHGEMPAKFDGKDYDYPEVGPAQTTTAAYKWIDDSTFEWITKVNGKPTTTTHVLLSRDGKTLTLTTTGTNAQGQKVNNVAVFEKQ
jgi:hypothetical protein